VQTDGTGGLVLNASPDDFIVLSPVISVRSDALRYHEGIFGYFRHFARESRLMPWVGAILLLMLFIRFMLARIVLGFVSLFMFIPFAFWVSRMPGWIGYFAARRDIEPRVEYIELFTAKLVATWPLR
jgi:hypothetical protein